MTRFFDLETGTLHVPRSYAGAVKIPAEVVARSIKVKEHLEDDLHEFRAPKLRRTNAGIASHTPFFFSVEDQTIKNDNYDIFHGSNSDLVRVETMIDYR
jgi:hypothetical protein